MGSENRKTLNGDVKCELHKNINKIKFGVSDLKDVIKLLGKPIKYLAGDRYYEKSNLPSWYIADYLDGLKIVMYYGKVIEIRFEDLDIVQYKSLNIGAELKDVFKVLGKPKAEVEIENFNSSGNKFFADATLYKYTINGCVPCTYYVRSSMGIRVFTMNERVCGIYFFEPTS